MYQKSDTGATVIAVVALIVAILAGVLAWMAYDRTGANLDTRIQEIINQSDTDSDMNSTDNLPPAPTQENAGDTDGGGGETPSTETQTVPQTQP